MNPQNHKRLDRNAIQEVAESLMTSNQQTSTLEVKNQLRKNGFYAEQKEVSRWMMQLAAWQNWAMVNAGNHRIYRFMNDTNDKLLTYLEKDNTFWEVRVVGKELTTTFGEVGSDGLLNVENFKTNRHAIHQGRQILNDLLSKGFVEAVDKRLSFELRKKYEPYFKRTPQKCVLGYYGVKVIEKIKAIYKIDNQEIEGYLLREKSAGFEFEWILPEGAEVLKSILEVNAWDALKRVPNHSNLTGGKVITRQYFTMDDLGLENPEIIHQEEQVELIAIHNDNSKLYNIRFEFENVTPLDLSKFSLDIEKEMIPLTQIILK